jgi:transposase
MLTTTAVSKVTVGVDVGDRFSELSWLDEAGEVLEEGRIRTTRGAFRSRFEGLARCRVVLEVGTHSRWVKAELEACGHEVVVANARKVRLITEAEDKDDAIDANLLARLGRFDPKLLKPIQHRSERAQADLELLRARDALVRSRTLLINHVRGVVKTAGARLPRCSAESFGRRVWTDLPADLRRIVGPVVEIVTELTERIRGYDKRIEELCEERYPQTARLRQPVGVGPITALAFVLTLDDPKRFRTSRSVGPYLGLCRRRHKSGSSDPQLGISKCGNPFLRRLLLQAAHYILGPFGPDCDLRRWGMRLASSGRAGKKRAVVAVARKLAVLLHRLWVSERPYEPLRQGGALSSR